MSTSLRPGPSSTLPPLPEETFRLLGDLVRERSGLRVGPDTRDLVHRRLAGRLRVLGLRDFFRYYFHLRFDADREEELTRVFELVAVHESYFFRHPAQMRALREEIFPEVARGGTVRVWCVGCSTGEEVYTVAWLARDIPGAVVVGTDLCPGVLEQARRGVYGQASFRGEHVPPEFLDAFQTIVDGVSRRVVDGLRDRVRFEIDNLMRGASVSAVYDVILCRNVLSHIDPEAHGRALERLTESLRPGGYLLIGADETLADLPPGIEIVSLRSDLVYRAVGEPRDTSASAPDLEPGGV